MEKTRLNLQWLSKGKSIRKRDLKQIGSYVPPPPSSEGRASPVSNPTASSGHKVGSSHNTEGAVVSGPQPAAVGLAPAPDCRAKLPVEHSAHLTQGKHFFPAGIQSGSSVPIRVRPPSFSAFLTLLEESLGTHLLSIVWSQKQLREMQAKELSCLQTIIMPPEVETMTKKSHHNLNHCSVSAEVEIQSPEPLKRRNKLPYAQQLVF